MKIRFRYLENSIIKDFFKDKSFKNFLKSGNYISDNIKNLFEQKLKKYIKTRYIIGVSSGTNSIYLSLKTLNLSKIDEVLVPSLSWVSTFTAIERAGAKAVPIDIDDDLHLDFEDLKKKINNKTKAVLYVHFGGMLKDLTKLKNYLDKKKICLIEDCAQVFGTKINNKHPGTFGDFGTFSMNPMKLLPSIGEAGAISCNKKKDYDKIKILRYAGVINGEKCLYSELNHKIDNLLSLQIVYNLKKVKNLISKKIFIAEEYNRKLTNKIIKPKFFKNFSHNYYSYIIFCNKREKLIKYLNKNGIETKTYYQYLIYDHKPFKNLKNICPNAEKLKKKMLCLPIDENLSKKQIQYVINKINSFYLKYE